MRKLLGYVLAWLFAMSLVAALLMAIYQYSEGKL